MHCAFQCCKIIFMVDYLRKLAIFAGALLALVSVAACGRGGVAIPAVVTESGLAVSDGQGGYTEVFVNGVNIGAAKPGSWPGEFAVTYDEYIDWFDKIAAMNVDFIRVYVTQSPDFYRALLRHNRSAERPLYLIQGIYLDEEMIAEYSDAFCLDGALLASFVSDVETAVAVVHGDAEVAEKPGTASGRYTADVSDYVAAWILGIEWSAEFVIGTDGAHPDTAQFAGEYVYTEGGSPFEVFLAEAAEAAVACDMAGYGCQRPVALSNWVTTDPISHPGEPNPDMEDAVSVDTEHIKATAAFSAGMFASYHVYPYYPDAFSYQLSYVGSGDPYLAYLEELTAHHAMPVLVAEYGIPTSRGRAHENAVTGMCQGYMTEEQQGEYLIELNEAIVASGCMGGLIFSWQDEWFKTTWNSMEQEESSRRPYWHNVESPEQCFGLLAFDAGGAAVVTVDGDAADWEGDEPLAVGDGLALYVRSDGQYVYLLIEGDVSSPVYVPVDTIAGQGNTAWGDMAFAPAADFLLVIDGEDGTRLMTDAYYDVFQYQYSVATELIDTADGQFEKDSGVFAPIYQAMSRGLTLPETGENVPFSAFETGRLSCGLSAESNLADFCFGDGVAELRIPWFLFNVADPSSRLIVDDFYSVGGLAFKETGSFSFGVSAGEGRVAMSGWELGSWEQPEYRERLKASYYILADYFGGWR